MTPASLALARAFAQLARVSAATITKSHAMEQRLPRACRPRNHVIPNGVDLERFAPLDHEEARLRLGWSGRTLNVLFVGNPELPRKNFALAKSVCDELARRHHEVSLRVAWDIAPDQVPIWLSASDALIFPSLSEGSPNVIKEAMAAELPIVSAPVGDVPERLAGVAGTFIAERRVDVMADALTSALRVGRATAAREAVTELSIDRVAARVIDVYRQVTGGAEP
jgi:glycosyltransferase involved in cell wall biosynthesis